MNTSIELITAERDRLREEHELLLDEARGNAFSPAFDPTMDGNDRAPSAFNYAQLVHAQEVWDDVPPDHEQHAQEHKNRHWDEVHRLHRDDHDSYRHSRSVEPSESVYPQDTLDWSDALPQGERRTDIEARLDYLYTRIEELTEAIGEYELQLYPSVGLRGHAETDELEELMQQHDVANLPSAPALPEQPDKLRLPEQPADWDLTYQDVGLIEAPRAFWVDPFNGGRIRAPWARHADNLARPPAERTDDPHTFGRVDRPYATAAQLDQAQRQRRRRYVHTRLRGAGIVHRKSAKALRRRKALRRNPRAQRRTLRFKRIARARVRHTRTVALGALRATARKEARALPGNDPFRHHLPIPAELPDALLGWAIKAKIEDHTLDREHEREAWRRGLIDREPLSLAWRVHYKQELGWTPPKGPDLRPVRMRPCPSTAAFREHAEELRLTVYDRELYAHTKWNHDSGNYLALPDEADAPETWADLGFATNYDS